MKRVNKMTLNHENSRLISVTFFVLEEGNANMIANTNYPHRYQVQLEK